MKIELLKVLEQQNPWLKERKIPIFSLDDYYERQQIQTLLLPDWDSLWTVIIGPRRAGKTTLGMYLCQCLINQKRFKELLYLNCDLQEIREWLISSLFLSEAMAMFKFESPIIFIDEVQRLPSPGLLLKTIADLKLPIKMIASGSSQLEIKSKVQEHVTGRHFSSLVLPLSFSEWNAAKNIETLLLYGAYPQVIKAQAKELLLGQLYQDYINKDIIEILQVRNPDIFRKLLSLLAHSSGQLINYNQLAADCQVSSTMVKHYLAISEQTFITAAITPFVGNKRTELTSNPIYYFLDTGFRNYALRNFNSVYHRTDIGLLVQGVVFQEIYKFITQHFLNYTIHYWRTKSGAEVDFIIYKNDQALLPIEVKFRSFTASSISRGYRSFLQAYQPKNAIVITKNWLSVKRIENTDVYFIPIEKLEILFERIREL